MHYGFIKTRAQAPSLRVADCAHNAQQIIECARAAERDGVRLLVLPELCITGYTCGDLFLQDTLLLAAERALIFIAEQTAALDILIVAGLPLRHRGKLYNCAALTHGGRIVGIVPKTHVPNYGEFYEGRHFSPAPPELDELCIGGQHIPFGAKMIFRDEGLPELCIGIEICEDLWASAPPSAHLCAAGALIIANPSASNETVGKHEYRRSLVATQSGRCLCGYIYAGQGAGESTTDTVYAAPQIICENGAFLAECAPFGEGRATSEIDLHRLAFERRRHNTFEPARDVHTAYFRMEPAPCSLTRAVDSTPFVPSAGAERAGRCELILDIQAHGLIKRLEHAGAKTALIGLSGGLDSTLALLVAARAFDRMGRTRRDICAVTMPCFGTTSRTRSNAEKLAEAMGVSFETIDITEAVTIHLRDIGHELNAHDVTYENAQARERTQVLMDLANARDGLVVGTGDLSELALGWATFNGDHMSMYGVNGGVPKTLVRHIVAHVADSFADTALREVLLDILDTPVSPELLPPLDGDISQRTEDLVGPYELHDFFLYYSIRWGFSPGKVFYLAQYSFAGQYGDQTILRWLRVFYRRFFAQQFKRSTLPDGPKVGSVSLSPRGDWRMPSDASAALWLKELDELERGSTDTSEA